MPETMSLERRLLMKAYGAELVLTEGSKGMSGASPAPTSWPPKFPGRSCRGSSITRPTPPPTRPPPAPRSGRTPTARWTSLWRASAPAAPSPGVGRYLKSKNPAVRVVGVEPATSAVLSGGAPGRHDLQGLGAGFVPKVLDTAVYDEILPVADEEAYAAGRRLGREEGVLAGISAGAAVHAAILLARRPENKGKTIVTLLPDTGDRYLSTKMFAE